MQRQDAAEIRSWLTEGKEFALLDVREAGQFGEGHLLYGITLPYSRLEVEAPALVTSTEVPVRVVDGGEGVAELAARRLVDMGYRDVAVVAGGLAGCEAAGFTVLKGVNVPSKALGELVEVDEHTPHIAPEDLKAMIDRGDDFILLDGRTPKEFTKMSIPTGRSCPNAELSYRLPMLIDDPKKTVVVNCAGRTRSIIGAQSLRNMGFENPIYALENGTQGWLLAGFQLDHGLVAAAMPDVSADGKARAAERAKAFMARTGVPLIDADTADGWARDTAHAFYLLDVRTAEEFKAGHLPGAVHAPGGQLVQATDQWIAVRGGRIVLCDDHFVRAANTAYWLRTMGHEAYVLDADVTAPGLTLVGRAPVAAFGGPDLAEISAADVAAGLAALTLVDLRPSADYRKGRIEGAVWSIRPKLASLGLAAESEVVIVAESKRMAEIAAVDLREAGVTRIRYLPGGPEAWRAAGLLVAASADVPADAERIDFLFFVHDRHDGNLQAARNYLSWETGLVAQLKDWERGLFTPSLRAG